MSKHLTAQGVELYHQHRLRAEELLEADAHLSSCAACRDQLKERAGIGAVVEALRADLKIEEAAESQHPAYAQFTAYALDQLDNVDREIMDSHLSLCAQCEEVMQDLRVFMAAPEPAPVATRSTVASPSFRDRFAAFRQSHMDRGPWQFAGATALLLLLAGISAAVWFSLKSPSNPVEVARVTPSPVVTESPQPNQTIATAPTPVIENAANSGRHTNGQQGAAQQEQSPGNSANTPIDNPAVTLKDGGRIVTVDDRGNVSGLEALSATDRQTVSKALTTAKVEAPSTLASIMGSVSVLRGGAGEGISFPILNPVGTIVMTDRPTLRWGALDGATNYSVSVFDRNFKKVAASQSQAGTQWTVTTPLARGGVYTWQVTATRNNEEVTSPEAPAPEAKFMVLDAAKAEELSRARRSYKDSHLTLGTLYARAGLLDEAEREFQLLLRDNPKSPTARKLLQSVRALRNSK